MNNQKNLVVYSHHKNNFINDRNEQLQRPNDNLTSSSSTTTTNNIIDNPNNYFYSNYKTPKKNMLPIHQSKNICQIPSSKTTIYSKGKIQKAITNVANSFNTNNIIINNNTNIINNNNTNIINNNISSHINDKDYARSISQLNIEQINELTNNYNNKLINKTIFPKKQIINKKKIIKKNNIIIKNTNIINKNVINNNLTCGNNFDDKSNNFQNNNNYNMTECNTNKSQENNTILNVEEILMIEEKLSSLINCLVNFNPCTEECFECLNFYFTTKLSKNLSKYFIKENNFQIIKKAMKLKLFAYILCYDISLNEENFPSFIVNLDELFGYVHNILILISKYFCNKISDNDNSNIWVKKLQNLIHSYDPDKKSANMIFEEINLYCFKLTDNLYPQILQKYNQKKIIDFYSKIFYLETKYL